MPTGRSSTDIFLQSLFQRLQEFLRRGFDISRNVTLTGALIPLPAEKCIGLTMVNTTGADVLFSVTNTTSITLPDKTGITIDTNNTSEVSVSGTGTLSYIVSK
jgi:hypothetical protein